MAVDKTKRNRRDKKKIKNLRLYEIKMRGRSYWRLMKPDPSGTGRIVQQFSDQNEANTAYEQAWVEHENHGLAASQFSTKERGDALAALDILRPFGVSLVDAAEYYRGHHQNIEDGKTVKEAAAELLKAKKQDGLSARYTKDLRNRLDRFVMKFGERKITQLSVDEIETWLRNLGVAPLTRNTFWLRLSVLFEFARKRGWCARNPMEDVEKAKWRRPLPGILTPEQFSKLLEVASPETLPYWAVGGWCGLRSAELERLEWQDVDLDAKLVTVTRLKSKTASDRHILIRPALAAWLESYRGRSGHLCPVNLRTKLEADRERAGIKDWPANALRHSFASYCLEHLKEPGALTVEMGHTDEDLVSKFYRQRVRPEAAKKWWAIMPQQTNSKIVELKGAAA